MKQTESEVWYFLMGIMMGLVFSPFGRTYYWLIGAGILLAWAARRDMIIWDYDEQVKK